jgi:predicted alpha/beta-hydrolase family hydrolase
VRELNIDDETGPDVLTVSALLIEPPNSRILAVLAHGAGAGMRHAFMQSVAESLASRGIATLRYNFPYMESKGRRPDPPNVAERAIRAAVRAAGRECSGLPLIAGGKSFGGRMTSLAAARKPLDGVHGIFFVGFPLHPPKRPEVTRAEHLRHVRVPTLFLQGTRDDLADLTLLEPIVGGLGQRATLHIVNGADHSFAVLKRSGRTNADVIEELTSVIDDWATLLTST